MAQSITRWYTTAQAPLGTVCPAAIQPYVTSGETDGVPNIITISAEQYECHRTWTTTAGAQNWLDMIDGLAAQVDVVCLEKILEP